MRYLTRELERFLAEERKMALVAGPRQVGKTTLAKQLLSSAGQESKYFNWDIESHRKAILKDPETFWSAFGPEPRGRSPRIALDEIHKYPRWKRFLKGLYDSVGAKAEIVATGSGRLDVYQRGGDSLFGRSGLYRLHPFTLGELLASDRRAGPGPDGFWSELLGSGAAAGAEGALGDLERLTGFPEPLFAGTDRRLRRWRRARRQLVLREDLRDLSRVRDLGLVEALVALLPERIGAPLSLNALSEELGVAYGSVRVWIETLARLYFLFVVRPYAGRLARTLRKEAKVYLFDFSEIEAPGPRFENLVALHVLKLCDAWNDWGHGDFELRYVRDKEKREVDFLVTESGKPYLLLEAKHSGLGFSPSLMYFSERLKPDHAVQLARQAPPDLARKGPSGALLVSASRFLSRI